MGLTYFAALRMRQEGWTVVDRTEGEWFRAAE